MEYKETSPRHTVYLHRGDLFAGQENTIDAAISGTRKGYGVELDFALTKDREWVVFHDNTLTRMTGLDNSAGFGRLYFLFIRERVLIHVTISNPELHHQH